MVLPWATSLAGFSASLIALFEPKIITYGNIIQSQANGFGVAIEAGCNAVLAAAIRSFGGGWHTSIQVHNDLLATLQIEKLRAEISKLQL